MNRFIYFVLFFILLNNCFNAQTILTLEKAISIAQKQSFSSQNSKQSLISSQKGFEATKMGFRTSVNLEFDLPSYNRTLSSQFNPLTGSDQFYPVGNTTVEARLNINQPILFTNGTLSLSGSIFGRDQFGTFIGSTRDYYSDLRFQLSQPLFAFNSQLANLKRAEINLEKTKRNYSQDERELIYNVTVSFFNLYKAKKSLEITEEKVKQTEDSYNTAQNKYKAGLIAEVDALQLEVDFASSKNDLLNSRQLYDEAKNEFKLLIGLDMAEDIDITAQLDYLPVDLNVDDAVKSALNNRSDILNAQSDLELGVLNIDEVNSRKSIKASLNASYGLNKDANILENVFNNFADSRSVTFTVSVPIWDWGKNSLEVESANANYKMSELAKENLSRQITKEVQSAINRINSARARVEILKKNVELAEKSYSISVERFKTGNITSFNLSQMQLKLTDTKMSSLNAIIDYKIALADLERKTWSYQQK